MKKQRILQYKRAEDTTRQDYNQNSIACLREAKALIDRQTNYYSLSSYNAQYMPLRGEVQEER